MRKSFRRVPRISDSAVRVSLFLWTYTCEEFESLKFSFDRIATEVEKKPFQIAGESPQNYNKRKIAFLQRQRLAVDIIKAPIRAHMTAKGDETYFSEISALEHPKLIFDKLKSIIQPQGSVESATRAFSWVSSHNRFDDIVYDVHFAAHQKRFYKNKDITLEKMLYCLNSLSSRFSLIIQEFISKEHFTQRMLTRF